MILSLVRDRYCFSQDSFLFKSASKLRLETVTKEHLGIGKFPCTELAP